MISDILKFCTYKFCFGNTIHLDQNWKCDDKILIEDHLYCVHSGYAEFEMEGVLYPLEAGKSYLFPANRYITYHCPEAFSLSWFHFHVRIFDTIDLLDHIECPYVLPIDDQLTKMLYRRLYQLDVERSPEMDIAGSAIIQQLCSPFFTHAKVSPNSHLLLKLEPALHYIERNMDIPIRVSELAKECGYEESYFADLFSKLVGVPPAKFIVRRKIEKAKAYLTTGYKLNEICKYLGFYDLSHFSRSFKKLTGMTAKQYRDYALSEVKIP